VTKILFLAASPKGTSNDRSQQEIREIEAGLERSQQRSQFSITARFAARPADLRLALEEEKPDIVHFSGHSGSDRGIVLQNEVGEESFVPIKALADLFEIYKDTVKCVVLNACYTQAQAEAIAQHIDYVVGTTQAIKDESAIEFAVGFYDSLGGGRSYGTAFKLGCTAVAMAGDVSGSELPKLITQNNLLSSPRRKIFISYKRDVELDESIAKQVREVLSEEHDIFIDKDISVGTPWAERIRAELEQADFLITFLSAQSVHSEMVRGEIETAYQLYAESKKPTILPVRLNYRVPFTDTLGTILDSINWAFWDSAEDTERLIEQLRSAIRGDDLPVNTNQRKTELVGPESAASLTKTTPTALGIILEEPLGVVPLGSRFYIERQADRKALQLIQEQGQTITIIGVKSVGTGSLLLRLKHAARQAGKQIIHLELYGFNKLTLSDSKLFFRRFCYQLTEALDLTNWVPENWNDDLSESDNCTRCIKKYVLPTLDSPLVLIIDKVHRILDYDYCSDFFGMLRAWHSERADDPRWEKLDLIVPLQPLTAKQLNDECQSSFLNACQRIELSDFSQEQVIDLNQRYGSPLNLQEIQQLMDLLGGHPLLLRQALYKIASQEITLSQLFEKATADDGPFRDHLRYRLFRLVTEEDLPLLRQAFIEIVQFKTCSDQRVLLELKALGLVRTEDRSVLPRCQLYAKYVQELLNG
jgi:AAA-like domain/TIR domain/CHAT domain